MSKIDPLLIYNYTENHRFDSGFLTLIGFLLLTYSQQLCFLAFILNHIMNSNIVSTIYPLSIFLYGLIETPHAPKQYWKF